MAYESVEEIEAAEREWETRQAVILWTERMEEVETEADASNLAAEMTRDLGEDHPELPGLLEALANTLARIERRT